jgi:hypothetical protein
MAAALLGSCSPAERSQSADEAYQACLKRAHTTSMGPRDTTSLSPLRESWARRDAMEDGPPAVRSRSPGEQCNDLRLRRQL